MREETDKIINKILLKKSKEIEINLAIDDNFCKDYDDYILYVYNSKEYLKKGNISSALVGNRPFIIDKINLNVYQLNDFDFDEISVEKMLEKKLIEKIDF